MMHAESSYCHTNGLNSQIKYACFKSKYRAYQY